jgi:hypothetical protein
MKKLIWIVICLIIIFAIALNSSMIAEQGRAWVQAHPKDPNASEVLYRTARWCDLMGDDDKAIQVYWQLYQEYPERGDLCAPALYHCAYIKANGSSILGIRKEALQYTDIIIKQYSGQGDWATKAKVLSDEVNYVH